MHALENLRGVPKKISAALHQGLIHSDWNRFYRENPVATLEQLKAMAAEIDRKYGHQFLPPKGSLN